MPRTYLTAEVASIRVNCQIYETSVIINTFLRFLLKQSTLLAFFLVRDECDVIHNCFSCDVDIYIFF